METNKTKIQIVRAHRSKEHSSHVPPVIYMTDGERVELIDKCIMEFTPVRYNPYA